MGNKLSNVYGRIPTNKHIPPIGPLDLNMDLERETAVSFGYIGHLFDALCLLDNAINDHNPADMSEKTNSDTSKMVEKV